MSSKKKKKNQNTGRQNKPADASEATSSAASSGRVPAKSEAPVATKAAKGPLSSHIAQLDADLLAAQKKLGRTKLIYGILLLFVFVYMTFLYSQFKHLSPDQLAHLSKGWIRGSLPSFEQALTKAAKDLAPDVVGRGKNAVLETPAMFRKIVHEHTIKRADEMIWSLDQELEKFLDNYLDKKLAEVKERQKTEDPQVLIDAVSREYREHCRALMNELYMKNVPEVHKFKNLLKRLQSAEDLDEAEKLQKEALEVWATLLSRYQWNLPDLQKNR